MKTALIVDDIPEYVENIAIYLEDQFAVLKAFNMEEAKRVVGNASIDLAILDIRLNENDPQNREGLDLLRWLKEKCPDVGIIVMSAYREFDHAVEALNAGADYFMRKPIQPVELEDVLGKLMASQK